MNQVEIDKITANHDPVKSSAQALQLEALAIHDLLQVVKGFQPGQTVTVQSYAALEAAVKDLSETNTALQTAVPAVPKAAPPAAQPIVPRPGTRIDSTHKEPGKHT